MQIVRTADGKAFEDTKAVCVGSVPKVQGRDVTRPPKVGEFPVFVEQDGLCRMFTYSRKIVEIENV